MNIDELKSAVGEVLSKLTLHNMRRVEMEIDEYRIKGYWVADLVRLDISKVK